MANPLRCSCPNCMSGIDTSGLSCSGQGASAPGAAGAAVGAPKADWSSAQIAANLTRSNTSWTTKAGSSVVVTYRFLNIRPTTGVEAAGFSAFNEAQKYAARIALQTWADAANIKFVESSSTSAQIVLANTTSGPGQAWAYMPGAGVGGDVWINPNQASNFQLNPGGYGLLTMIHEIGHALGLSHPGDYDASKGVPTYANDAKYFRDSRQYSDMSYFSASNTGANHGSSYAATPLLDDILAIQRLYGVNTAVRNTATTYGFASTASLPAYNFAANATPVVTIIDAGGDDTINLSGYKTAQRLDLHDGTFSDIGGLTANLSIAYGTIIENAIGGSNNDTLIGNDVANRLTGGAGADLLVGGLGDDVLIGGDGTDTVYYERAASAYSVLKLGTGLYQVSGADGVDRLEGVELLRFASGTAVAIDGLAAATVLSVSTATVRIAEGNSGSTNLTFTITRSGNTASAVSTAWSVGGTGAAAASAADFLRGALPGGTVSFAAGETVKSVTVAIAGDAAVEADESFALNLTTPSAGVTFATASATAGIANDDVASAVLSIAADAAWVAEGNTGATPYSFSITRGGNTAVAASAAWKVAGAAPYPTTASDFAGGLMPGGTISFAAGETRKTLIIGVAGDTLAERDEGFTVTLATPGANTTLGTYSAAGLIRNDDIAAATLSIAALSATKAEGAFASTAFTFLVTRSGNTAIAAAGRWTVAGAGAAAANAADFAGNALPTGTVAFAAGETSKTISVLVAGDTAIEANEGFTVSLAPTSAATEVLSATAAGSILNDDIAPATLSLSAAALAKVEGTGAANPFSFTVTRTGNTAIGAIAAWRVTGAGLTAASAADFAGNVLPSGTVTFNAGETSKTISFQFAADTKAEANEALTITLSAPSANVLLGTATLAGSIINDDAARGGQVLASGREVFAAADSAGRTQVWVGDTVSARQLTSGTSLLAAPRQFVQMAGGNVVFTAADSAGRSQLFATDGLAVSQLSRAANVAGLQPADFTPSTLGRTVFTGLDALGRSQLWSTDGTGLQQLTSIAGGLGARSFAAMSDGRDLFLGMDSSARLRTWITDGSAQGTYVLA